jgi:hypothetical protein
LELRNNRPEIRIEKRGDYLLVTPPTFESLSESESQVSAMRDAAIRHNATKLLIDMRATRQRIAVVDLYEFCLDLVAKFGPLVAKIAVVASPEAAYPNRFGETVVRNRGLDCIRFVDNEQEALDWLMEA